MKKTLILIIFFLPLLGISQNKNILKTADSLFSKQKFSQAAVLYKKIINESTYNSKAYNNLAICYVKNNFLDSAKSILNKSIEINGKDAESYANLANICITLNQLDSATIFIQSAKILKPDTAEYYAIEGSIYLLNDQVDTAFSLFEIALSKDKYNSKANFYISYIYSLNDYLDSALKYIDIALSKNKKADYYKLKTDILYKQERYTDALFEIDKAIKLDNSTPNIVVKAKIHNILEQYRDVLNLVLPRLHGNFDKDLTYYTIVSYYNLGMTDSAFYYLSYAHQKDPNNDLFYYLEGYLNYNIKNYQNAYINFKAAIKLNPSEPDYFYLYCESIILMNTDSTILNINKKFIDLNQENMAKMKKLSNSKKSKYYFPKLKAKFNAFSSSFSLDDYFMLYYGYSIQPGFSGYSNSNPDIAKLYEDNKYDDCINLSKKFISDHPTSIVSYYYLANSYYSLKNYDLALKYLTPYYGFIYGIIATGDGMSKENAYIVTSVVDEYSILNFFNTKFAGQKLLSDKKHNYDVINYLEKDKKNSIFFNIDLFFGKN